MIERILSMIGIGRVTLVDDSKDVQLVQVTERASGAVSDPMVTDNIQRLTEYGFSSFPPDDCDVLVIRRGGMRVASVAIATSHKASRPRSLKKGDVALYDFRGRIIKLTEDGIEIDAAGGPIIVRNASKVRCECDIETTGDVISRADGTRVSLNGLRDAYNAHKHPTPSGQSGVSDRQV